MRRLAGLVVFLSLASLGGTATARMSPPAAPTNLVSTPTSDGKMLLSWNGRPGIVKYELSLWMYNNQEGGVYNLTLHESSPRGGYWRLTTVTVFTTSLKVAPAFIGRLYAWHVRAKNASGWSLWSKEGAAHWLGTPPGSTEDRPGAEFYWGPALGAPTATATAPLMVKSWESFLITGTFGDTLIMLVGLQRIGTGEWVNPPDTYATMAYSGDTRTGVWSYTMDPPADLVLGEWYQVWVLSWNPWQSGLVLIPGAYVYATS